MSNYSSVFQCVLDLIERSSKCDETLRRVEISFVDVSSDDIDAISLVINSLFFDFSISSILRSRGMTRNAEEPINEFLIKGDECSLFFSKDKIAEKFRYRECESSIFYFEKSNLIKWLSTIDPFNMDSWGEVDFRNKTTFIINDLESCFGGEIIWFVSSEFSMDFQTPESLLPNFESVQNLVHVVSNKRICVSPRSFEVLWGEMSTSMVESINEIRSVVYTACIIAELSEVNGQYFGKLKGSKQVSLKLDKFFSPECENLVVLERTIKWIYEERKDTRLRLVMDRLSIECDSASSLVECVLENIEDSLIQAKDSYAYVILERKDEYYKELREIMKDVNSQAQIYAEKVRSIVASLARDVLGIFLFFGLGFIGKFNSNELDKAIKSNEFSLFAKFLAIYLLVSMVVQILVNYRDSQLTFDEGKKWLKILKNYTSLEDGKDRFLNPLKKRKNTLCIAMIFSVIVYCLSSFAIYNLPFILELLLNQ